MAFSVRRINVPSAPEDFERLVSQHYALQCAVLKSLPADQDYLHKMSRAEWRAFLKDPRHHMIGVYDGDGLIAQLCVLLPDQTNPDADMLDMVLPSKDPNDIATFRTVMTHPEYRGHGLMNILMTEAKAYAKTKNRTHLLGCITRKKTASWSQFLKAGFSIVGAGFDPSDNSTVYYAHNNTSCKESFNKAAEKKVARDLSLKKLKGLFNKGYRGVRAEKRDNKYTGRLVLKKFRI